MKHTKLYFLGILPLVWEGCNSTAVENKPAMPNVIYVFPDQMRNHAMEFWNEPDYQEYINFKADPVHTPNLNRFAKESVVLTSAMSNYPLSSPHRGSLLTGMYPENSGVSLNCNSNRLVSSLCEDAICIGDVFKKSEYACAYIGKLHVDFPTPNNPQAPGQYVEDLQTVWDAYTPHERRHGFDYWYSYGTFDVHKQPHYWDTDGNRHEIREWSPTHETDKAIAYLRNEGNVRDKEKPFFMMISYNPPHSPYQSLNDCMEEDYNLYKDISLGDLLIRPNADTTMQKAACVRYYFASVTGVDREFGRLLDELEKLGLDNNTIVVFTSDHGETMCSQGINDPKNSPYAESMNVPFLVRYPGKLKPRVDSELLLSTPDIMPTLLGLAGLKEEIPLTVEGRNYAGWFTRQERSVPLREAALYIKNTDGEKDENGKVVSYFPLSRGIKTKEYTLTLSIDKETRELDHVLLFNDKEDPYQLVNLPAEENKDVILSLCRDLLPLLKEADDPWYKEKILSEWIPYIIP